MSDPHSVVLDDVSKTFARERNPASIYRAFRNSLTPSRDGVAALRNVSCTIGRGEKIGIIGDNGSGKTTLLKLIAGLHQPTSGRIEVRGEMTLVAGLGLGMIDEASVEENIVFYGAIYGIGRDDIRARLPEILEWAELSEFRRTKLKNLSTGMRSRLAFSAMRHVDADIYLMDEVLSAGDVHFAQKCQSVFEEYRRSAKTFIVAAHHARFILSFCDRVLWLERGRPVALGAPEEIMQRYAGQANGQGDGV